MRLPRCSPFCRLVPCAPPHPGPQRSCLLQQAACLTTRLALAAAAGHSLQQAASSPPCPGVHVELVETAPASFPSSRAGVHVELMEAAPAAAAPRMRAAEDTGTCALFSSYADMVGMHPQAVDLGHALLRVSPVTHMFLISTCMSSSQTWATRCCGCAHVCRALCPATCPALCPPVLCHVSRALPCVLHVPCNAIPPCPCSPRLLRPLPAAASDPICPPPPANIPTQDLESTPGGAGLSSAGLSSPGVHLEFQSLELEGYLSFREAVQYPLSGRGLVVVSGAVEGAAAEGAGVQSNGAGKSALVMAPLWALTGDTDMRAEVRRLASPRLVSCHSGLCSLCVRVRVCGPHPACSHSPRAPPRGRSRHTLHPDMQGGGGRGLTNADLVHDDAKSARVRVEGMANGVAFAVERRVVRKGKGGALSFELGGEDRTRAEVKLTQAEIERELGAALLGRAVFHQQSDVAALLDVSVLGIGALGAGCGHWRGASRAGRGWAAVSFAWA